MAGRVKEVAQNRRARFDYEILDTYEAGLVLKGTEIKSVRINGASIAEAFVSAKGSELYLMNSFISPYQQGGVFNHEERRDRKLLLHHKEVHKIFQALTQKGLTCIPLSLFFKGDFLKIKVAIAKGKKLHDKRSALKKRDLERELRSEIP